MRTIFLLLVFSATVCWGLNTTEIFKNATEAPREDGRQNSNWFYEFGQNYVFLLIVLIFIAVAYLLIRKDVILIKRVQKLEKELGAYDSELLSSDSKEFSMEFYRQV